MSQPMPRSPLARAVAAVGAVLVAALAIFIGAVAFLAFLGLGILAFVAFQVRLWWLRRRMRSTSGGRNRRNAGHRGRVIEGEYRRGPADDGD
jgi:membrane protein implicated in regulation of membrane protease activity